MASFTPSHFTVMQRYFSSDGNNSDKYLMQLHLPQLSMLSEQSPMDSDIVIPENSGIAHTWGISKQWDITPPSIPKFSTPSLSQDISVPNLSHATMLSSTLRPFELSPEVQQNHISRNKQKYCSPNHSAFFPPILASVPPLLSPVVQQLESSKYLQSSVYSTTGYDVLKMLLKVVTRPNARIMLGPVDMTCSFVVSDARHPDNPIVYASPTFCKLTGYSEAEILGHNCRFLQSPTGTVQQGESRVHTAPDVVRHFYRSLLQEKECQASLINYRKDGSAFMNLVTIIPISEDGSGNITHNVGFQVDLAQQPVAALQKLRDGSYIVNYSVGPGGIRDRRGRGVSNDLIHMIRGGNHEPVGRETERSEIHNLVLDNVDDFIHVLSLKGSLLYAAPAISRVLGYDAQELVGRSIADLCHPADVVPVMRELKDASSTPIYPVSHISSRHSYSNGFPQIPPPPPPPPPRPTSLLFRALHKEGHYVWIISRGRLHVEPGKGRKAVVLVGRRINSGILDAVMSNLLETRVTQPEPFGDNGWGLIASNGIILSTNAICAQRLGFSTMPTIAPSHALLSANASAHQRYMSSHPDTDTDSFSSQSRQCQSHEYHRSTPPFQGGPPTTLNFYSHIPATLVGRNLVSLVISPENQEILQALVDVSSACDSVRKIRCHVRVRTHVNGHGCDETLPAEIRFYSSSTMRGLADLSPTRSVIFEMVFLPEGQEITGTLRSFSSSYDLTLLPEDLSILPLNNLTQYQSQPCQNSDPPSSKQRRTPLLEPKSNIYSYSSTSVHPPAFSPTPVPPSPIHIVQQESSANPSNYDTSSFHPLSIPQSSSPGPNAEFSALSSLSTSPASETSWQYELTRLRFENERMRVELAKLERIRERDRRAKFSSFHPAQSSKKRPRGQESKPPG